VVAKFLFFGGVAKLFTFFGGLFNLAWMASGQRHQTVMAAASPDGRMKPVNLAAQLAAAETELACLKLALAQVKEDRDELRLERDDWRREAEKLCAEMLIAAKIRKADERHVAPPKRRPWRRTGAPGLRRRCRRATEAPAFGGSSAGKCNRPCRVHPFDSGGFQVALFVSVS
jgi:hypothetical protein